CRNRFAITGETAEPCGVPRSRCCKVPSGRASGAASQRRTYSTTHGRSVTAWIALTARCHGMVSKNFRMSRSITQSFSQHRCLQAATASSAERPGRQPWESGWKTCSAFASITPATTVCATLSATAGTPGILVPPPCGFGISTARTGGGKQMPEESRFQILYRLFFRSDSNSATVTSSTPGAPLFALTFSHASQTARFEISNGLPGAFNLSMRFLPEHFRLIRRIKPRTTRSLRSAPVTGASPLLRTGPPARPATVLSPLRFSRSGNSLPDGPRTGAGQYQDAPSPVPRGSRRPGSRRLHAGHHLASKRISARLIPESPKHPGSDVVLEFRHVSNDSLALAFPVPA